MSGIGGWLDGWGEGRDGDALVRMSRGMCQGRTPRREAFLDGSFGVFSHGEMGVGYGDGFVAVLDGQVEGGLNEVIEAYRQKGREVADRLRGSFALAICDGRRGELILARGRADSPALYYRLEEGRLLFASEIRGLLSASDGAETVERIRLLAHLNAPVGTFPPESFYEGVHACPLGHTLAADRLGRRLFVNRAVAAEEDGTGEILRPESLLPTADAVDLALHEGLAAFGCPAFDSAMPSTLCLLRGAEDGRITVEDETLLWDVDYARERAARLGARFGVRVVSVPPKAPLGRGRELKQMEALLRERLAAVDPYLLSYLFEGRQETLIAGEKRIEKRIRRMGMMLQTVLWSHWVAIV